MPRFSIILPCFNAEATLGDTLASLQAQTCNDWEAICVDDGSSDTTRALIRDFASDDPRIVLAQNPGKGPSDARNHGALAVATGTLIAFCDADDIWAPSKLGQLAAVFADPDVHGAFGQIAFFKDQPADAKVFSTVPSADLNIHMLLGENPVCTMSNVTVRKDIFLASGGFDPSIVHNEDLEWLIRIVGQGARVVGVNALHTYYRTSTGGLSSDLPKMLAGRDRALATAADYGVVPTGTNHAIHHRYLARRALRLGQGRFEPLRHALTGLAHSPSGFLFPLRRGGLTFAAALSATLLPSRTSQFLFSR
jgi:glycosyltransferase involved in cell wall biosynthesis